MAVLSLDLTVVALLLTLPSMHTIYQSFMTLSPFGMEFRPWMSSQQLSSTTVGTKLRCAALCNQLIACRTFDYDTVSKRCRLFEADTNTGSIIASSSSSSMVGSVRIDPSLYVETHGQPCALCQQKRYDVCSVNTSSCQCPANTYWNGVVCALQLFTNQSCSQVDACRSDLNLTCSANCYGESPQCQESTLNSEFDLHSCI
jgi:PAN domain